MTSVFVGSNARRYNKFVSRTIETNHLKLGTAQLETFTELKELVENPRYHEQRQRSLNSLSDDIIDSPIVKLINGFNRLPYCFTLQSCYGHFVHDTAKDPHNLELLPITNSITKVEYRIAYVAFCIEDSSSGLELFESLNEITAIDTKNIQFCCAEWFWNRQINSYALQVEPDRFKDRDKAIIDYKEALRTEKIRNEFFVCLQELVQQQLLRFESG